MRKSTKILLAVSLTAVALGFTDILWGLGKPVGAICFGLFMIFKVLDKETELYDEEQRLRLAEATRASKGTQRSSASKANLPLRAAIAHS